MWCSTSICIRSILLLLYINDLTNISPVFKPILFANDTTLIFNDKSIIHLENQIKHDIDKLYSGFNINKLFLKLTFYYLISEIQMKMLKLN